MHNIVFVCRGNTCRSAMAEAIAKSLCKDPSVVISSAGLEAVDGGEATDRAVGAMGMRLIDLRPHRSRALTLDICQSATVIYGMTEVRIRGVSARFPSMKHKVHQLDAWEDIPDPIGETFERYLLTAQLLEAAIKRRFKELGVPF